MLFPPQLCAWDEATRVRAEHTRSVVKYKQNKAVANHHANTVPRVTSSCQLYSNDIK